VDTRLETDTFRVFKALYDNVPFEIHVWELVRDPGGAITGWRLKDANPRALKAWGRPLSEVIGCSNEELFPNSRSTELFLPVVERIFESGRSREWEEFVSDTGQMLQMVSIPVDELFISCGMDVSAVRDVEAELLTKSSELDESTRRLQIATEAARIGIWEYDLESASVLWDKSMYAIYGVPPSEEKMPYDVWANGIHEEDAARAAHELESAIASRRQFESRFRVVRQDNSEIRHIYAHASIECNEQGQPVRLIGVNIDESERLDAEDKIQKLAYYDTLTGLPNRALMTDRLEQAIKRSSGAKSRGAVVFIDLDNFKYINDCFGHGFGDEVLATLAPRIKQLVSRDDTLGRFGGDEFVIILNSLPDHEMSAAKACEKVALKVAAAIAEPIELSSGRQLTTASIGISIFGGFDITADEALRQADLAMYRAKSSGRNAIRFFDETMQKDVVERVALEQDLENALEHGGLAVHYQAQVDRDGNVLGAEALLRWCHPKHGYVPPNHFIPLAEETGQINKLGRWVLRTVLGDLKGKLQAHADDDFRVAINVSAHQFYDPDFQKEFRADVLSSGISPSKIMIELTESALVRSESQVADKMESLKRIGIQFSLDDFGTGYSSLTRLKQLPINELKIDQSFVRDIETDGDNQAIARSVIALATSMGISVIAEGVESEKSQAVLEDMGCYLYQGYLYGRPIAVDEFAEFLQQREQ